MRGPRVGHARACAELAAAMAIVGSGVVVGKLLVARVPVFVVAGLRLAFASAVLVPMLLAVERGWPRLTRRELGVLALQAFCGIFLFTALLLGGLTLTTAAAAGIVTATTPAVAAALSALLLRERLTAASAGGIALAVLGILALEATGPVGGAAGTRPVLGTLLVFGAVIGEGMFVVCGKVAAARVPPLTSAATLSVFGLAMFLPFTLWELSRFDLGRMSPADWGALAYWGLGVTALAFVLWARGLAVVQASTAAAFTAVLPVSAVLLSYLALGEPFRWAHLVGGACVIGGIVLLARGGPPRSALGIVP